MPTSRTRWTRIAPLPPEEPSNPRAAGLFERLFAELVRSSGRQRRDQRRWAALDTTMVRVPRGGPRRPAHLYLDEGYDYAGAEVVCGPGVSRPMFAGARPQPVGRVHGQPRRRVVERTGSWRDRSRALLVRRERIGAQYVGLLHLACALIAFQQLLRGGSW